MGFKQRIALGAAVVALATGGTIAAVAASGRDATRAARHGHGPQGHGLGVAARRPAGGDEAVSAAARYLGTSAPELRRRLLAGETLAQAARERGKPASGLVDAIVAERTAWLTKAAASGRIAPAAERKLLATLRRRVEARVNQRVRPGRLQVAASYLGISRKELVEQRRAGKSLAEIAQSRPGKSAGGLIDAIVAVGREHLQVGAATRHLPQRTVTRLLAELERRVRAVVYRHARTRRPQPAP